MSQPVLSIIIPSYQRGDLLAACLHSIEKTAQLSQLQVIVVDDASPEKSISHCASRYSWVTCILQGRRQGFCAAVNAGLRLAKAEVVQVLNDDTEVLPNWYPAAIKRFREDPTLGSVTPLVLCWNQPAVIDSAGDGYDHGGYAYSHGKGHLLTSKWLQARDVQSASACAAFYRRTALLKVGGFPEEFVAYFDDLEVGLKL
ncbi:MAG TPA: glycosyltransferase, partial [Gemmatales bacterium]|nr:glycosyltransferase [Gemmatales bacterium]